MAPAPSDLPAAIQDLCDRLHCDPEVLLVLLVSLLERELHQRDLDLDELGCIEQLRLLLEL